MLPPPDDFARYDPDVRERIMRWNDAFTVDESRRQDRLVDAQIEQARKGPVRSLLVVGASFALAAGSVFGAHNTAAAAVFLGAPILLYATSLLKDVRSRSSHPDENGSAGSA